jgi:hypothetical protein
MLSDPVVAGDVHAPRAGKIAKSQVNRANAMPNVSWTARTDRRPRAI